jgi:hypothetical protein
MPPTSSKLLLPLHRQIIIHHIHNAQKTSTPLPPNPIAARPSHPTLQHASILPPMSRLSGSTIATPAPATTLLSPAAQPTTIIPASPAPPTPITASVASIFPTDLPPRPTPTNSWVTGAKKYIFPRPTIPARPDDIEMGGMSHRRYVSGDVGARSRSGRKWSKSTIVKTGVVVGIVVVFWVLIILGIVWGGKKDEKGGV